MGKISKLFKGELKKIFLGPGIFFMAAFLILALTIAPKLFNPTQKNDLSSSVSLSTSNVTDVYSSFLEYESDYALNLTKMKDELELLVAENADFKQNLTNFSNDIFILRMELNGLIFHGEIEDRLICVNQLISITNQLNELYNHYTKNYSLPLILVDEDLDFNIRFELAQLTKILTKEGDTNADEYYTTLNDNLENYKYVLKIKNYMSLIKNLEYSNENLQQLLDNLYYNPSLIEYKNQLLLQITDFANQASADEEFKISTTNTTLIKDLSMKYLANDYNSYKAIQNGLSLEVSSNYSDSEISGYVGFSDFNRYKFQENYSKYNYLLENKEIDSNFSSMFSFNRNSQENTDAFDYMYFAMEIASFLIIAFTVVLGAGMISKEFTEGTIKLLAIRPFKRNKIILSKILATMFMSFIFVLISVAISLITGIILYGVSFSSMLVIFNSTIVFALPNWVVFLIYVVCLMIKIWIFVLIAIAISTLFKSYVAAVCISSFIYIFNMILTFVSNGANWLKYNIFANLDFFKYFGGSFTNSYVENQNLTNLFVSPVFADTNIWFSVIIVASLAFVLNLIIFTVFKHRDIT